ncbi:MAG: alpha-E domain-containing protein [Leadbetterella sp.]
MLSRVANCTYWMSRYLERTENYTRLLLANLSLSLDLPTQSHNQWKNLLVATHDIHNFRLTGAEIDRDSVLGYMTFSKDNPFSIYASLKAARDNARSIRESIPKETWEHINVFYNSFKELTYPVNDPTVWYSIFENLKLNCQTFYGIIDSSLTRKVTYHFLQLGKYIERADKTSRFLDIGRMHESKDAQISAEDFLIWTSVLKSIGAFNMYRLEHKNLDRDHILQFLLHDESFPRSLQFCVTKIIDSYNYLEIGSKNTELNRIIADIQSLVRNLDKKPVTNEDLKNNLDFFQVQNNQLDNLIHSRFFYLQLR